MAAVAGEEAAAVAESNFDSSSCLEKDASQAEEPAVTAEETKAEEPVSDAEAEYKTNRRQGWSSGSDSSWSDWGSEK